jgi:alkylhydroperoxidase family enzyme
MEEPEYRCPAREESGMATTLLPPIEKPRSLIMKMVYAMSRRQVGKVITSVTVFAARMPVAFGSFYGKVSRLDKKLKVPSRTAVIIREQVATINTCLFCMDAARYYAMKESADNLGRFDALANYQTSPLFSDAERAALDYATELTSKKEVSSSTFAHLQKFYSEREICDIVWVVASEHLYNMTNIGLAIGSDGLCELNIQRSKASSKRAHGSEGPVSVVSD